MGTANTRLTLRQLAAAIVENLNGMQWDLSDVLADAKDSEISEAFKRHGLRLTPKREASLLDLIGYAEPFVTEADVHLSAQASELLRIAKEMHSENIMLEVSAIMPGAENRAMALHRREEPNCEYCRIIDAAKGA